MIQASCYEFAIAAPDLTPGHSGARCRTGVIEPDVMARHSPFREGAVLLSPSEIDMDQFADARYPGASSASQLDCSKAYSMSDISIQIQLLCISFMLLLVPWTMADKTPIRRLITLIPCLGALIPALSHLFHRPILAPIRETHLDALTLPLGMFLIICCVIFWRRVRVAP